jgi:hypothetical protein
MAERQSILETVADALMREEPTYWGDFPREFLMAWLSDFRKDYSVVCAYCELPLMSFEPHSFRNGTVDHLLPKKKYADLKLDQSNGVPCCYRCNAVKGSWDPNKADPIYTPGSGPLSPKQREELIRRAREHVHGKLAKAHPDIWRCWKGACEQLESGPPAAT